jgi:hypothetical protein
MNHLNLRQQADCVLIKANKTELPAPLVEFDPTPIFVLTNHEPLLQKDECNAVAVTTEPQG